MTTATHAPQVWRGYDALAQADQPPGLHYSATGLATLRTLNERPGLRLSELARLHGRQRYKALTTLRRLQGLELAYRTGDGRTWPIRWWLTEHGRELVALIDREGIV